VAGSEGVIEALACGANVTLLTDDEPPRELPLPEPGEQFVDYVTALAEERECAVPAEECYLITEVALRARDAAVTGRAVTL
jgi:hypothetical protein